MQPKLNVLTPTRNSRELQIFDISISVTDCFQAKRIKINVLPVNLEKDFGPKIMTRSNEEPKYI